MKLSEENGETFVEYEDTKGRIIYEGVKRYVKQDSFQDRINDSDMPESFDGDRDNISESVLEKVSGVKGFKKLDDKEKEEHLRRNITNLKQEERINDE